MKYSRIWVMPLGVASFIILLSFVSALDNSSPKSDVMIADWERAKAFTLEYIDAANDEVITFKPHPEMRTFGQQMLHIAGANYGFASAASGKTTSVASGQLEKESDKYATKEELRKAVVESYDFVISALRETGESKMNEGIKVFNRFEMTRERAFEKAFEHQTHHRGQTTVYLRLKGIKPPNEKLF